MSNTQNEAIYTEIMGKVCENVKELFENEGMDDSLIIDFKTVTQFNKIWFNKIVQSGIFSHSMKLPRTLGFNFADPIYHPMVPNVFINSLSNLTEKSKDSLFQSAIMVKIVINSKNSGQIPKSRLMTMLNCSKITKIQL